MDEETKKCDCKEECDCKCNECECPCCEKKGDEDTEDAEEVE